LRDKFLIKKSTKKVRKGKVFKYDLGMNHEKPKRKFLSTQLKRRKKRTEKNK